MHCAWVVCAVRFKSKQPLKNPSEYELNRCQAPSHDLDQGGFMPNRTHEFDTVLLERVMANVLWDEYGIAGDLIISQ